jgi:hypothetical protein
MESISSEKNKAFFLSPWVFPLIHFAYRFILPAGFLYAAWFRLKEKQL